MAARAQYWFQQAERDLEQAEASRGEKRHEWACFAAQQSAEKAVKALHRALGQDAWGHVVARLLTELPIDVPEDLVEKAMEYGHSSAAMAAECALQANAHLLFLNHISGRYEDATPLREEAAAIFPSVQLPQDLDEYLLTPQPSSE